MGISGFSAVSGKTTRVIKNGVDVKIETYKEYPTGARVTPGEVITFIPKVLNVGIDCYLRVKIDYVNSNTDFLGYVTSFPDALEKHGDYYYLKRKFKANETLPLFNTIKIPEDIEARITDNKVRLEITVEAIQTEGFEPDYSLEDPWKGVIPEKNTGQVYYIDDGTEEPKKKNPKTGDSIGIDIILFVISAIGLTTTMILYSRENKKSY